MKKIIVNQDACIGCGACISIDPAHFDFNEDGLSEAINNDNLDSAELLNAKESCPTCAISITESEDNCKCNECNCENCECE